MPHSRSPSQMWVVHTSFGSGCVEFPLERNPPGDPLGGPGLTPMGSLRWRVIVCRVFLAHKSFLLEGGGEFPLLRCGMSVGGICDMDLSLIFEQGFCWFVQENGVENYLLPTAWKQPPGKQRELSPYCPVGNSGRVGRKVRGGVTQVPWRNEVHLPKTILQAALGILWMGTLRPLKSIVNPSHLQSLSFYQGKAVLVEFLL